jgi:hypothetical protein
VLLVNFLLRVYIKLRRVVMVLLVAAVFLNRMCIV